MTTTQADLASHVRFQTAMQRTRLAVYAIAIAMAWLAKIAGVLEVTYAEGLPMAILALASGALFLEAYRRSWDMRLGVTLTPAWMACDVFFIAWGVFLTGGGSSPWFLFYLSNTCAAAFVAGRNAAAAVAAVNTLSYLAVLALLGEVRGFDRSFWLAATRMLFLYGASIYFFRGILRIQEKNRRIRALEQEQARKVEQLLALTQDLDQGTRALAEANLQIREADRMKSQFLANMSHELRTPLNSIIGFSEILLERLSGEAPTKYVKFLRNIHSSGQHLLGIINDILDLSKVEAGKMDVHPERFAPVPVIEGILNVMHGTAGRRQIAFEVDAPEDLPTVETDPARFKQVLYNLLSNAVKFSPEGATVTVRARRVGPEDSPIGAEALAVSVVDRGIGIAPSDQEVIFHEFRQVDGSHARAAGGTGLGLAIVKKFVELLGGAVTLESELGRGSTFTFTLPLSPRAAGEAAARPAARVEPPRLENPILVVEDDLVAYKSISRALAEAGYFPIRARHGEEALQLARKLKPTAITLDLVLPGLSGWEVLKALKRDPETEAIPVVIISLMDNRELGLTLGAVDYFLKPVDRGRLIARLREVAPVRAPETRRLLVVDDDPQIHDILEAELGQQGYVLDHALSGEEGLARAEEGAPDAIILDLMMPGLSGFEVAEALKERPATSRIPILVLTAKDLTEAEREYLEGKIAALVQKGQAAPPRLVAAIRELEARHAGEAARVR
jgi:signal transduction histidine kinase/DNA-binding response OmpR family regulator